MCYVEWRGVTKKSVLAPVVIDTPDAECIVTIMKVCTYGLTLAGTRHSALGTFRDKLTASLMRQQGRTQISLWTLSRSEAEAAFQYVLAFTHPDAPEPLLSDRSLDSCLNVAIPLFGALDRRRGRKRVSNEEAKSRLEAFTARGGLDDCEPPDEKEPDERFLRRLKRRLQHDERLMREALNHRRAPLDTAILELMKPRDPDVVRFLGHRR